MSRPRGAQGNPSARLLLSILCLALLLAASAPAAARSWSISHFDDSIVIDPDGTAMVIEHLRMVFVGHYNGIYRDIPLEYPGPRGTNFSLLLDVLSITDGAGQPLKYEKKISGGFLHLKIYVPGADDTDRQVDITYRVRNGIRFFEDHDEFYWNVTGNDWPVPIDSASARVVMPENASGLRAQAFTGTYGSTDKEASAEVQGSRVTFQTTNPLPMRGNLTIDIYVPKGILQPPSQLTLFWRMVTSNPIVFLPLLALAVMGGLWYFIGRDPDPGISVAPLYEPPKGMTPAEVGALIDDSVDPRDITSTLIDLAVRGYIRIEESEQTHLLMFKSKDYIFHSLKEMGDWDTQLAPHEKHMMVKIFGATKTTRLSELKDNFYTELPVIRADIKSALKSKGMYLVDPDSGHGYGIVAALAIVAPFAFFQLTGRVDFFSTGPLAFLCIGAAVVIVIVFTRIMPAKSLRGARTWVAIRGFQEFMTRVEEDRLKRMPPDTFEKFLPYAMALGVEERWAKAFAGIIQNPPSWYTGNNVTAFNPVMFTSSMNTLTSSTAQTFASAPRSSSSGSGFGGGDGGGFSGGGFGGGGGDAF